MIFSVPPSITHHLSLEDVLERLQQHDAVAGLVVAGSGGRSALKSESDYDIVVVLRQYPQPIHVALTTIDGRMADIVFWRLDQLESMVAMQEVPAISPERAVFHWLKTGTIHYDPTGKLDAVRQHQPDYAQHDDRRAQFDLWYRINFNLYHGQRMLASDDEVYLLAMDFRFLYMLDEVMRAYMMNYNIPQHGEKHTIRHLQQHAPEHLQLYVSALHAIDRQAKFEAYRQFAKVALKPVGGLWDSEQVTAFNLDADLALADHPQLMTFWESLVGEG